MPGTDDLQMNRSFWGDGELIPILRGYVWIASSDYVWLAGDNETALKQKIAKRRHCEMVVGQRSNPEVEVLSGFT